MGTAGAILDSTDSRGIARAMQEETAMKTWRQTIAAQ